MSVARASMSISFSGIALTGLPDSDKGQKDGVSDPYCVLSLLTADGTIINSTRTEVLTNRRNAKFSDPPAIAISQPFETAQLKIDVIDEDGV